MDRTESQPQQIGTSLASLCSETISKRDESGEVRDARKEKNQAIIAILAKLALHYWRPDFTETQSRQLYADYLDDLQDISLADLQKAVKKYRTNESNKFFPRSGELIGELLSPHDASVPDRERTRHREKLELSRQASAEMQSMIGHARTQVERLR